MGTRKRAVGHPPFPVRSVEGPEEQAVTMKRKFRKMWRKALKDKAMSGVADPQSLEAWYGSPGKMPTANQKNNRKALVKAKIIQKVLEDVKRLRDGIV